jgi:hypothetical protein
MLEQEKQNNDAKLVLDEIIELLTNMRKHLDEEESGFKMQVQLTAFCINSYMINRLEKDITRLIIKQTKDLHRNKSTQTRKL